MLSGDWLFNSFKTNACLQTEMLRSQTIRMGELSILFLIDAMARCRLFKKSALENLVLRILLKVCRHCITNLSHHVSEFLPGKTQGVGMPHEVFFKM